MPGHPKTHSSILAWDTPPSPKVKPEDVWDMSGASLGEAYQKQAQEADKITLKLGYPELDRVMRGIKPGEVVGVIARTAVGKSAFGANVLRNMSGRLMETIFFSLEMPREQVYERYVQMEQGLSGGEVEQLFKNKNKMADKIKDDMGRRLPCIQVVDRPGLTTRDMINAVWLTEDKIGRKIKCLLIDYLGLVKTEEAVKSVYERTSAVALQMRGLAKETATGVIVLHQVSRKGGDGSEPVTMDMARDSGVVEEAVDHLISLYLPKRSMVDRDSYRHISLLKNRRGPCVSAMVSFSQRTLLIEEVAKGEQLKSRVESEVEKFYSKQGAR